MEKTSKKGRALGLIVLFFCTMIMVMFIYILVKVSFQDGTSSAEITQSLSYRIGSIIFDGELSDAQMEATNRILRFTAHFALFAFLGYGLGVLGFLIFTKPFGRIFSVVMDGGVCLVISYMTEYYKQFISGRHFHLVDATINFFGSVVGICALLISLVLYAGIHSRTRKKD